MEVSKRYKITLIPPKSERDRLERMRQTLKVALQRPAVKIMTEEERIRHRKRKRPEVKTQRCNSNDHSFKKSGYQRDYVPLNMFNLSKHGKRYKTCNTCTQTRIDRDERHRLEKFNTEIPEGCFICVLCPGIKDNELRGKMADGSYTVLCKRCQTGNNERHAKQRLHVKEMQIERILQT